MKNDFAHRILFLMSYDLKKTLNEQNNNLRSAPTYGSSLMNVSNYVNQETNKKSEKDNNLQTVPTYGSASTVVLDDPNWKGDRKSDVLYGLVDPHVMLPTLSIVVGLVTGGIGGLVLSGLLELADVAIYISEDDYETAGISLIFSLIPFGVVASRLVTKLGKELVSKIDKPFVLNLLKKIKNKEKLNTFEKKVTDAINEQKGLFMSDILKISGKIGAKKLINQYTGRKLLIFILYLIKYGYISSKAGVKLSIFGGVFVTFLQLGKLLGLEIENFYSGKVEVPEKLKLVKKEVIEKELLNKENEIKTQTEKTLNTLIEMSDEKKNEEINKTLYLLENDLKNI